MSKVYAMAMLICAGFLAGCEAEVGGPEVGGPEVGGAEVREPDWCAALDEKSKADWTANEAEEYVKRCVLSASE